MSDFCTEWTPETYRMKVNILVHMIKQRSVKWTLTEEKHAAELLRGWGVFSCVLEGFVVSFLFCLFVCFWVSKHE